MKSTLVTVGSILFCLVLGKVLTHLFGFLPASLYGMLIYAALLATGIFDGNGVGRVISKVIYFMPVVFLPVCIGVMKYGELFEASGWKLISLSVTTTLVLLLFVGFWGQRSVRGGDDD